MSAPKPTRIQSIALWRAYEEVCVYCSKPIESLATLEVDHIIPASLCTRPEELRRLLDSLGTPDLEINSYSNWLPAHGRPCNRQKGDQILPLPALLHYLSIAHKKLDRVVQEERKIRGQAQNRDALAPLVQLIEEGRLSKREAISFIEIAVPESPAHENSDPLVLSFSVNVIEAADSGALPPDVPEPPLLYGWLENELEDVLRSTKALFARAARIEDDRNGETVSVRYAFWLLDLDLLPRQLPYCWELLEVAPFSELYPNQDPDNLL
jgi:hypothetical protein